MAEFFNFLSVNPTAYILVILVVMVIVAIFVVGFLQGREVTLWPPKISKKPEAFRRMTQIGEVSLAGAKPNNFHDGTYKGRRSARVPVTFEFPFQRYVNVVVSLKLIDVGDGLAPNINRLLVAPTDIGLKGFNVYFETWEDSKVWDASASWVAVGE